MSKHSQQQAKSCRWRGVQRHVGMSGDSREKSTSLSAFEMPLGKFLRRLNGLYTEARHSEGMTRHVNGRRENLRNQIGRMTDERRENGRVSTSVRSKT